MTEEDIDNLEFIPNPFRDTEQFETFGEEREMVLSFPRNHIITVIEEDGELYYTNGFHYVNRIYYLILKEPYTGEDFSIKIE